MGGAVSNSSNLAIATNDGVQRTRRQCKQVRKGDRIPSIVLKGRIRVGTGEEISNFAWKDVTTEDLFKGKRIVLFSLPGGTCLIPFILLFDEYHSNVSISLSNSLHAGVFL